MAQGALDLLAKSNLTGTDFKVLMKLLGQLDFDNLIQIEQAEIARQLGMHRPDVNKSIKRLVELGSLLEGPRIGRSRTYRLNPDYGWKGSAKSHIKAVSDRAEKAGLKVHEGGKGKKKGMPTDAEIRAEMEAEGQERLFD